MRYIKYIVLAIMLLTLTSADIVIDNTKTNDVVLKGAGYSDAVITPAFQFTVVTNNAGTSNADQFTMPLVSSGAIDFNIEWGDGTSDHITAWNDAALTHTFLDGAGTYTCAVTGTLKGWKFAGGGDRLKLTGIGEWGVFNLSTNFAFFGCANLNITATDAPTITSTDLQLTFKDCSILTGIGDATSWDVSSVTSLSAMFQSSAFNQDISGWDVSSAQGANNMFLNVTEFNQDLSSWSTLNFKDVSYMFFNCDAMRYGFAGWDLSAITSMTSFMESATGLSTANYDATLIAFDAFVLANGTPKSISCHFGGSKYTAGGAAAAARARLVLAVASGGWGWTITDGGVAP